MREIVSPLSGIRSPFGVRSSVSPLAIYAVLGFTPELVLDFDDEKYFANSTSTTFSDAITHSASSNATMVDSDGLLKWRPHNANTFSEDFTNDGGWFSASSGTGLAAVVTANAGIAPNGSETADRVVFDANGNTASDLSRINKNLWYVSGADYTFGVWMRSFDGTEYTVQIDPSVAGFTASVVTVTADWQLFPVTGTPTATSSGFRIGVRGNFTGQTADILIWGAHLYRSDLGGMVDNPDRGDSYVPTTSAARYLPRRGHHVWNGSAWVNEGLLHESEARTNLLTYSEDLSNAAWTKSGGVTIGTPVTRKGISLDLIQSDGVTNFDTVYQSFGSVANGAYATFSLFIEAGSSVETAIRIDDVGAGLSFNRCTVPITWTLGVPSLQADVTLGLTFVDANLQDYGDGLYRVHLTVLNNTGGSLTLYGAYYVVWDEPAAAVNTYAGGFQAEIAPTPSSYIPTSGSTVTRAADVMTIPAANLPWNPLAVSIQMEGRVTYADTGSYEEFIFNEWYRDSNNKISFRVDTFGVVTGSLIVRYRVSGSDTYPNIANEFSPDVGIPYNVAYRATSTSVQLASGGTTSGVKSVTGLPDIENGTLYLGHSRYMGTIRTFRIWADDIGDAGLVEATT